MWNQASPPGQVAQYYGEGSAILAQYDANNAPTLTITPSALSVDYHATEAFFHAASGVTASDAEDGDLTGSIIITGGDMVDRSAPGDYTITYSITDSIGATATGTRVVTVNPEALLYGGTFTIIPVWTSSTSYELHYDYSGSQPIHGLSLIHI